VVRDKLVTPGPPKRFFFVWGKTHNGAFLGIFRGGLDLFDPKIALPYVPDILGVKKIPSKKSLEMPHYVFCPRKK
jgi:hypothetical protein